MIKKNTFHKFRTGLAILLFASAAYAGELSITVFNVGHGDAALVVTPKGRTMLIDTGYGSTRKKGFNAAKRVILPFLRKKNIHKLDAVVITHAHKDHLGGIFYLLKKIKVCSIYEGGHPFTSGLYTAFLKEVSRRNTRYILPYAGCRIRLDPEITITVLSPPKRLFRYTGSDANNNSIVLHIRYKKFSMLFTGDIELDAESTLAKKKQPLKCTVLKIAHHGSRTSSSKAFLRRTGARWAIISVGKNNSYGLPSIRVLGRLRKYKIKRLRTDVHGHIYIKSNGKSCNISWQKKDR